MLHICETEPINLPCKEKAENLGYGAWPMTSAMTAFTLYESDTDLTTSNGRSKCPGYRICIITFKCGKQMCGPQMKIRSDLSTCEKLPANRVNVQFPDSLKQVWSQLSEIDDMPYCCTKTETGVALLKEVRERLLESPKNEIRKKLLDIARPITSRMTQLRPSLPKEVESHLSIKHLLIMSLISTIGSMILHVNVACLYHQCNHRHLTTPLCCG